MAVQALSDEERNNLAYRRTLYSHRSSFSNACGALLVYCMAVLTADSGPAGGGLSVDTAPVATALLEGPLC